jgi:hypothetical protein
MSKPRLSIENLNPQTTAIRGDRASKISKVTLNLINLDKSILKLRISNDDRHMDSELINIVRSHRCNYLENF